MCTKSWISSFLTLQRWCDFKALVLLNGPRKPESGAFPLQPAGERRIESVRCGAAQSHGGECDETVKALHHCVLPVPFQLDASGDGTRWISAGRESGASEEDIKAAFIIHGREGGREDPHPRSNFPALFHLKLHFFSSSPRLCALPVLHCPSVQPHRWSWLVFLFFQAPFFSLSLFFFIFLLVA